MFPTYYVINYIYKVNDVIQSEKLSEVYNSIEEAEDELRQNGFIDLGDRSWYNSLNTGGISCVEAHIHITTSKYSDYMIIKSR